MRDTDVKPSRRGAAARLGVGIVATATVLGGGASLAAGQAAEAEDPGLSAPEQRAVRVTSAIEFRRDLGLPTARGLAARLEADAEAYAEAVEQYGIPLTDSELERLTRRERKSEAVVSAVERYAEEHAQTYAGLYIDQASGGVVRVGFTGDIRERLAALRELAPFPGKVAAFRASFSERELAGFARRIAGDLSELRALGAHQVGVDVARNAVRIEAAGPVEGLDDALGDRYPGAPIDLVAAAPAKLAANYERFYVPPMVGAIQIYRFSGGGRTLCSAGFIARPRGSSRRGLITAGHCGQRRQIFWHDRRRRGPYRVGRVTRDAHRSGSTADALLIARPGFKGAASIYTPGRQRDRAGGGRGLRGIRSVQRKGGVTQGEVVCRSGYASKRFLGRGVFCGRVEQTNVTAFVFPGPTVLRRQVAADVNVCAGDSGGPVYKRHQARGIVSAGAEPISPQCSGELLYSQIGFVQDQLNVNVVTRRRR